MYYIGTKEQCESYLNEVNQGEKYKGITSKWAEIIKGQSTYAIIKHNKYTHSNMILLKELPSDFTPAPIEG